MMKLMPTYSVAVYSAQKCLYFDSAEAVRFADLMPVSDDTIPDSHQLKSIQQTLSLEGAPSTSRIIVLVPDSWLSVSQHRIDHPISSSLLPLAALSYAVETTFSPPESVMFSYVQEALPAKHTQLTVFACSNEWAQQLLEPFQLLAKSCCMIPQGQWVDKKSRAYSWLLCTQRALSLYQPDKEKRKKARRLWGYLLLLSLLIHSVASVYFWTLQQHSEKALMTYQKTRLVQSDWVLAQEEDNIFSESVLGLVQALPKSARLGQFDGSASFASFKMVLPKQELDLLLGRWQKQRPDWRWEIEQSPYYSSLTMNQEEVVGVSISVFEN
jgi:hypothetical protein